MPRLFLGCPISQRVAAEWEVWFGGQSAQAGVRFTKARNMHVTIMFFGETSPEHTDRLIEETRRTFWPPIRVSSGEVAMFGRSALAVELSAADVYVERLKDVLGRTSTLAELEAPERYSPSGLLHRILPLIPEPEMERWRRADRYGHKKGLHCTVARVPRGSRMEHLPRVPLSEQFSLDRLILYESKPSPDGSEYVPLAQARPYEGNVPEATERLEFRTWADVGERNAALLWCDPQVTRFIGGPFDLEYVRKRLADETESLIADRIQYWPIYLRGAQTFVGCCGLRNFGGDYPWLGFHLLPTFWRQGLAVEASNAVLEFSKAEIGVKRVVAGRHPENLASEKVLQQLGFVSDGVIYYEPTGLIHQVYSR